MRIRRMNYRFWLLLVTLGLGASFGPAVAADGDQYLGTWAGTWAGDNSSGHFQLMLERGSDGKLTGSIAVTQDSGGGSDYTAKLKDASFAGDKFTAAYDPPDGQSQINMKGTFRAKGGDGDWSLGAKAQPSNPALATGTWKISKP
ncbi:MAG TPA: hypothetical protein VGN99_04165 [Steroidobacteraceae bacterium]|jgi:hypothetical protein|nr:hypothetical protein [Steroidobacteraceae bacterium]